MRRGSTGRKARGVGGGEWRRTGCAVECPCLLERRVYPAAEQAELRRCGRRGILGDQMQPTKSRG